MIEAGQRYTFPHGWGLDILLVDTSMGLVTYQPLGESERLVDLDQAERWVRGGFWTLDPLTVASVAPCWPHKWVNYVGFTEVYSYCTLCGDKRPL